MPVERLGRRPEGLLGRDLRTPAAHGRLRLEWMDLGIRARTRTAASIAEGGDFGGTLRQHLHHGRHPSPTLHARPPGMTVLCPVAVEPVSG